MSWDEFKALLSGIGSKTPLGNIVAIRAESDKDVLKNFSKEQHKIRNQWRNKTAKEMDMETYDNAMANFERIFSSM